MITHTEKLRVAWVDTDASERIHYTAGMRYFEAAEQGLMRKLLNGRKTTELGVIGFPRAHVEADYLGALMFDDEFECTARIDSLGKSSITYGFKLVRSDGVLCLVGKIVAVAIDANGKPVPFPDEFRTLMEKALPGPEEEN